MFSQSCKYTLTIRRIQSVDGEIMPTEVVYYFAPLMPLWGNPEIVGLDMRTLVTTLPSETVPIYMYQASLDAWRGIGRGNLWTQPDVTQSLDELLASGADPNMIAAIECYVRWRSQYLMIVGQFPNLGSSGSGEKVLGDFKIVHRGSVADLQTALQAHIIPEMNACYYALTGVQKTKASARIVIRGASPLAEMAHQRALANMPPGVRNRRNWDRW